MESKLCKEVEPQLDAFHDGELAPDERESVSNHLSNCGRCVGKLAEIDRVVHSLRTMPRLQVSSRLSAQLDNIAAAEKAPPANVVALRPRLVAPIAAAAAAVVAILFGWQMLGSQAPHTVATSPTTQGTTVISQLPQTNPVIGTAAQPVAVSLGERNQSKSVVSTPKANTETAELPSNSETKAVSPAAAPVRQQQEPAIATAPDTKTSPAATAPSAASTEEELAEVPATHSSFNEALGISTDEDGLYDIKM